MFLQDKKNSILLIEIIIIFILISIIVFLYLKKYPTSSTIDISTEENITKDASEEVSEELIYVEIKGAVKKPGVYQLNKGAIINDLVKLANGFKSNAYTLNINLSKSLEKETVIYVFTKTEYNNLKKENKKEVIVIKECNSNGYLIDNCTTQGISNINASNNITPKEDISTEEKIEQKDSSKININTATLDELLSLTGIGEKKALSIIDYRNNTGSFNTIEDIMQVNGIAKSVYEKIKDSITV